MTLLSLKEFSIGIVLIGFLSFTAATPGHVKAETPHARDAHVVEFALENDFFAAFEQEQADRTTWSMEVEVLLELDFQSLWGWQGWEAGMVVKANRGNALAAGSGEILPFSSAADDRGEELEELWLQKNFLDGQVNILMGHFSAENDFDVREMAGVFVNGGFEEGPELAELGGDGGAVTPLPGLGARLAVNLPSDFVLRVALVEGKTEDVDPSEPATAGYFHIAELNWAPAATSGTRYGAGAWYHSGDFQRLAFESEDPFERGATGYYVFAEGHLLQSKNASGTVVSGFVRLGFADDGVSIIASHQSAGVTVAGLMPGRDEDVLGFGITSISNARVYRELSALNGEPLSHRETAVELTYQAPIAESLSVQPTVQCVFNRDSDPEQDRVCAAGLRLAMEF